jgi:N-hydroxyarylamine O-acetyltransferase
MDEQTVRRYLDRIGAPAIGAPSVSLLCELHVRHLEAVPFENLSIHLGERIVLDEDVLVDKIVDRGRGGFCYELNGLFAALLRAIGFQVSLLSAGVHMASGLSSPLNHLALRVDLDERYLVDVGFGAHSRHPLRLDWPEPQADPDGEFLLIDVGDGDVDVLRDGEPQYRVEARARSLADFVPTCWWHQTSPDSHFTKGPTCSRSTADGRVTLADHRLIQTVAGVRTETELSDQDALAAYREHFGIVLTRLPAAPNASVNA